MNSQRLLAAAFAATLALPSAPALAQWSGHMGSGSYGSVGNPIGRMMGGTGFGADPAFDMTGWGMGAMDGSMGMGALMGGMFGLDGALGLTPGQRAQIGTLTRDFRRARWSAMGEMMDEAANLRLLLAAPVPDAVAIAASRDRLAQLRSEQLDAGLALRGQVEALLTPAQRDRLQALRGCS